jgi:hypothetical protein
MRSFRLLSNTLVTAMSEKKSLKIVDFICLEEVKKDDLPT